ncbi:MAG: hypothetical protein GTN74_03660 [Proteobacteria bacterium]|nr:hypothetical protein [Pseudomonadota bacterium]NIS68388.1 hypothetical protein [Pseudomonadota bacterium]
MNDTSRLISELSESMKRGDLPPWRAESKLLDQGVKSPDHFFPAALARKAYVEDISGEAFSHLQVLEKPYIQPWQCPKDGIIHNLEAQEKDLTCTVCKSALTSYKGPLAGYAPLVASYVAGLEDYISYCGQITVRGAIDRSFVNLTAMGPGMSAIGLARGCFLVNRFGGAEVHVEPLARTARCMGYIFAKPETRDRAREVIEANLERITAAVNERLAKVGAKVGQVEFGTDNFGPDYFLYVCFYGDVPEYRAHGEISWAVGEAREITDFILNEARVEFNLSVIAQGYDGDFKPSPSNKRGRRVSAQVRIPVKTMEEFLEKPVDRFLAFIEMDRRGVEKLGWFFYTGMGAEIISGLYKATRINPRMPLTTCLERIYAFMDRGDLVYGVELPSVEAGVWSSIEGAVPPTGREVMRIMGITNTREFCANLAAQVLAGEFNLACEIVRGKLYSREVSRLY